MLIYKVENKINYKAYVGQTIGNLDKRRIGHMSRVCKGCNFPFHNAIRKYGKGNFDWEIIDECSNIDELNIREKYWIKELNTLVPNGYNLQTGGNNSLAHEETRKKQSEVKKGKKRGPHTREHRERLSKSHKGKTLSKEHRRNISKSREGKKHTEEMKAKKSELFKGENNSNVKLKDDDIKEIRKWYREGMRQVDIAKLKDTSNQNIYCVVNYKTWKHIT